MNTVKLFILYQLKAIQQFEMVTELSQFKFDYPIKWPTDFTPFIESPVFYIKLEL